MSEESATPDLVERTRLASKATSRGDMQALDDYSPNAVLDTAGYGMGTFEGLAQERANG